MLFPAADIARGLERGEFFPVFQPLVELRTGRLAGYEVLARWRHPIHGILMPDSFIPVLEENGQMDELTSAMLTATFTTPLLVRGEFTLSVNISPLQLLGQNAARRIAAVAERTSFPLKRLVLEITESALLDDLTRAKAAAAEFKALECKLALDDFGTGYSSLRHLQALPFDELKVDRSFVSSMTRERESRKIVAAMVGLGNSLGLTTVAEGIETREQTDMLFWLGCDLGQGWLYGKPVAAEELTEARADLEVHEPRAIPLGRDSMMNLESLPAHRLAQLEAVYDGAPVGLCFLDRNLRYISLNRRLSEMNGVPAPEHLGRRVAEVLPKLFPRIEPFLRRALNGESISGVEIQKPPATPDGEAKMLLASYQPARDEGGEVLGVSVAIMDITHRKRTEAALRESEDHYRHMMQLSPHVPWVLDNHGEVIEASSRWESITGQPIQEGMGNGWLKMLHPEDVEHTRVAIRDSLRTGQPIDIEYRVHRPSGEWTWMRSRGSPRFGPTGKIVCIYGVLEVAHAGKQVNEELEKCGASLRAAVEAVPIGIVLVDAQDCTVLMVNPAALRIFGDAVYEGQSLADYTRLPLFHPDGRCLRPDEFPIVRAILRTESVQDKPLDFAQANGTKLRLAVSGKPIYSDDDKLIGGLAMFRIVEGQTGSSEHIEDSLPAGAPDTPASTGL
jgi:PAS domain S-box-containing protein